MTPTDTILALEKALEAGPLPWQQAREASTIEMHTEDWMQDEIDALRRIVDAAQAALDDNTKGAAAADDPDNDLTAYERWHGV